MATQIAPLSFLDTTILSNFAHAQRPDLVQIALEDTAATTSAVMAELRRGEALGLVMHVDWTWLTVLKLTQSEEDLALQLQEIVDTGEATCLAVAITRGGRLLSDDLAARRLARVRGVTVSGTIGLLLHLIATEKLGVTAADSLLDVMCQHGYRAPVSSLQTLLKDQG